MHCLRYLADGYGLFCGMFYSFGMMKSHLKQHIPGCMDVVGGKGLHRFAFTEFCMEG